MKNGKKGFAVAEILVFMFTTIMFGATISLQWHSADARNAKRTSDLSSLHSAIITQNAQWTPLMVFVTPNTNSKLEKIALAWEEAKNISDSEYAAGTPNYTALWVRKDDFMDPNGSEYVIAVTTKISWELEIAATMEDWAGDYYPKVVWTYSPRQETDYNNDNTLSVDSTNNLIIITDSTQNYFKRWDKITNWTNTTNITRVSADALTLTVESIDWFTESSIINIANSESEWLIDADSDFVSWNIVVDDGMYLPY